jgi:hypothetical protein
MPKSAIKWLVVASVIIASNASGLAQSENEKEHNDILVVLLEEANGKRSVHYQASPNCNNFLMDFRRLTSAGKPVMLTFQAPPKVTGRVFDAHCVRPDGSIQNP